MPPTSRLAPARRGHRRRWTTTRATTCSRSCGIADVIQHVDQDLYGGYVVATQPGDGLEAADLEQLPEVGATTGLRNFLYAVEWWIFGLFAAFIWWRWVREVTEPVAATETAAETAAGRPGTVGVVSQKPPSTPSSAARCWPTG